MSLRELLPKDYSWIDSTIEEKGLREFTDYANRVFLKLQSLKDGENLNLMDANWLKIESRQLFLRIAHLYLTDKSYPFANYSFNDDVTKITRRDPIVRIRTKKWAEK